MTSAGVVRPVGVPVNVGAFQAVFPPADIQLSFSTAETQEGQAVTLNGSFADPRTNEPHTVTIVWNDGSADATLDLAAGVFTFSAAHSYAAEGAYFPTVLIANADGQTAAGAEEQILPAAFLVVLDLKGEPGQTVSGAVTDPVSGDVIQASFTVSLADVGVAEFLAAQLVNVKLPTLPGLIEFAGIYDFREHNLGPQDSVSVTLVIRDSLALFEAPVLLYLDPRTNQEHIFKGNVLFTREPDILIVSITFDNASTPRLVDLTTTVFTVAIGVPGAAVTTAVSARRLGRCHRDRPGADGDIPEQQPAQPDPGDDAARPSESEPVVAERRRRGRRGLSQYGRRPGPACGERVGGVVAFRRRGRLPAPGAPAPESRPVRRAGMAPAPPTPDAPKGKPPRQEVAGESFRRMSAPHDASKGSQNSANRAGGRPRRGGPVDRRGARGKRPEAERAAGGFRSSARQMTRLATLRRSVFASNASAKRR